MDPCVLPDIYIFVAVFYARAEMVAVLHAIHSCRICLEWISDMVSREKCKLRCAAVLYVVRQNSSVRCAVFRNVRRCETDPRESLALQCKVNASAIDVEAEAIVSWGQPVSVNVGCFLSTPYTSQVGVRGAFSARFVAPTGSGERRVRGYS